MVPASYQTSLETTPAAIAETPIPRVPAIAADRSRRPKLVTAPW